jgi:hypothetical protein
MDPVRGHAAVLVAGALALLVGCASDARPRPVEPARDLHDPDPGRRLAAVAIVAQTGDTTRYPDLVELLEDRDPSIRMAANRTLEDMTGRTTDYRAFDPVDVRRPYVEGWWAWLVPHKSRFPAPAPGAPLIVEGS